MLVTGDQAGLREARSVSAGNTVQVGMELLKVLDIGTMRFEGMIAADEVGKVNPGAKVHFRVNGYPDREFEGAVQRINPVVNEATRQLQVLVSLPEVDVSFVAGLYAEGRIDVRSRPAILVPESALDREGIWPMSIVRQDVLQRTRWSWATGSPAALRDSAGVAAGDLLLRHRSAY
jgi:multidrug efflux pump subunit AcrA (membrane-fusion protein)